MVVVPLLILVLPDVSTDSRTIPPVPVVTDDIEFAIYFP
jgi:hypothetical protein